MKPTWSQSAAPWLAALALGCWIVVFMAWTDVWHDSGRPDFHLMGATDFDLRTLAYAFCLLANLLDRLGCHRRLLAAVFARSWLLSRLRGLPGFAVLIAGQGVRSVLLAQKQVHLDIIEQKLILRNVECAEFLEITEHRRRQFQIL